MECEDATRVGVVVRELGLSAHPLENKFSVLGLGFSSLLLLLGCSTCLLACSWNCCGLESEAPLTERGEILQLV